MKHGRGTLSALISSLNGQECWAAIAGTGTGASMLIHLGARIKRLRPLKNDKLAREVRENDARISLMIYCSWRIELDNRIAGGAGDSNEEGGAMLLAAKSLEGRRVAAEPEIGPGDNLTIHFDGENAPVLRIFPDSVFDEEGAENYVLTIDGRSWSR